MRCVYTGAVVFLVDYNACVRADVFADEHSVLIQWGMPGPKCEEQAMEFSPVARQQATHRALVAGGYHHKQRGITVIPRASFQGEFR